MDNKKVILESALHLFYEKGYDAVSVQEIADQSGISKPTLYYYFGSKLGLLQDLLESGYEELESVIPDGIEEGEDLTEVLYRAARAIIDYAAANLSFYLFMLSLFYFSRKNIAFKTVSPLIEKYFRKIMVLFQDLAVERGLSEDQVRLLSSGFTGILHHHIIMVSYKLSEDEKFSISDETVYQIVHQFMYGIYS